MKKNELVDLLNKNFPGPDYSKYYDAYELLEAFGAQLAKKQGYDAIILEDKEMPEFSEIVVLKDDIIDIKPAETAERITPEKAIQLYENREIPEGWYVHGREGRQDLETGTAIQLTKNWDIADQYAGKKGSKWLVKPSEDAVILDATNEQDIQKIIDQAIKDDQEGVLPFSDTIEIAYGVERGELTEEQIAEFVRDSFAPANIVDSAEAYDMPEAVEWLYNKMGVIFYYARQRSIDRPPKAETITYQKL